MTTDVTRYLHAARDGEAGALENLYQRVYSELRRLARGQLHRQGGGTLQATEVVHEAFMRLRERVELGLADREHFYAISARAMRRVLIDHFRKQKAAKRGGDERPVTLEERLVPAADRGHVLLDLDRALDRLAEVDGRQARVVELRFFGGLTDKEIAEALGVSERTVRRDWTEGSAWLRREMGSG